MLLLLPTRGDAQVAQQGGLWKPPFDSGQTLGAALETQFREVFGLCGIPSLAQVRKRVVRFWKDAADTVAISRLPKAMQINLPVDSAVVSPRPVSLERLFAYIARSGEDPFAVATPLPNRFIDLDEFADPALIIGADRTVYNGSCKASVDAALDAELTVPVVVKQAATNSFRSGTDDQSISLIEGTFVSPIDAVLQSSDEEKALYGRMLLWDWYLRNPDAIGATPRYRTQFHGAMVTRVLTQQSSMGAKAAFGAGVALPFASVDGSIKANLTKRDSTSIVRFRTIEYRPPQQSGDDRIADLPSAATLAAEIGQRARLIRENEANDVLLQTAGFHEQVYRLEGIPDVLCRQGLWNVAAEGNIPGGLSLTVEKGPPTAGRPWRSCRFVARFTPNPAVFSKSGSQPVDLAYRFTTEAKPPTGAAVPLALPTQKPTLMIRPSPTLSVASSDPYWSRPDTIAGPPMRITLAWDKLALHLDDENTPVQWSAPNGAWRPDNVTLLCTGPDQPAEQIDVEIQAHAASAETRLWNPVLKRSIPAGTEALDYAAPPRSCTLRGSVIFTVRKAGAGPQAQLVEVKRPLPDVRVYYPGKPQAQQHSPAGG